MKKRTMRNWMLGGTLLLLASGCETLSWGEEGKGALSIRMQRETAVVVKASTSFDDYHIGIVNGSGTVVSGPLGSIPDPVILEPGTYTVTALSEQTALPAFEKPIYGSTVDVGVVAGVKNTLQMICTQINAGLRIVYDHDFITKYHTYRVEVSGADGALTYQKEELRTGYFTPGTLKIVLLVEGEDPVHISKNVIARDMLVLTVLLGQTNLETKGSIELLLSADTSRVWRREEWKPGAPSNDGVTPETAYTVAEAQSLSSGTNVWVNGYIVGGDASNSSFKSLPPFTANSNLVIADSPLETVRANCMAIELPTSPASLRATFGMPANGASLLGRMACFRGNIETYFGHTGLRATKEGL
ncbi:MAG: DUF4493 domain-containing protein [Prevotellaceae bacterium]|nr:DUF4493 domain-containing protein [Prevotellaceae bacterium]